MVIDPFHRGATVTPIALMNMIRRMLGPEAPVGQTHLASMTNRGVLVRLLLNQATRAERDGDTRRALVIYGRMVEVAPSNGQGWWDLARLQLSERRIEDARGSLSAMLEITRDSDSRAHITAALAALAGP